MVRVFSILLKYFQDTIRNSIELCTQWFSIVVVRRAIQLDGIDVVSLEKVEFGDVEVCLNTQNDEYLFVVVKADKGILEKSKSVIGMEQVLCNVKRIKDCTNSPQETSRWLTPWKWEIRNESENDSADIAVLLATYTGQTGDTFHEQMNVVVQR